MNYARANIAVTEKSVIEPVTFFISDVNNNTTFILLKIIGEENDIDLSSYDFDKNQSSQFFLYYSLINIADTVLLADINFKFNFIINSECTIHIIYNETYF